MKIKLFILPFLINCSFSAHAVECWNSQGKGVINEISFDLTNSFNSTNNVKDAYVELIKNFDYQVNAICPYHTGNTGNTTRRSYITDLQVVETTNQFQYLQLNEYLLGAMQIHDKGTGYFYPPAKYIQMGVNPDVTAQKPFPVEDSNFRFRLKVLKPFIDSVVIPKKKLFTVYVATSYGDPITIPTYTISYSGRVDVPQNCKINSSNTVDIDFGKIPANAFSQAGKGNKPIGVNSEARTLLIKCENINLYATLSLRLESERSNNDIMLSDNPAIGFKVSDASDNVLIPNNPNSIIPFTLENPSAITIKAWPVSIDGSTPQPGPFNANGYLRVDFD